MDMIALPANGALAEEVPHGHKPINKGIVPFLHAHVAQYRPVDIQVVLL